MNSHSEYQVRHSLGFGMAAIVLVGMCLYFYIQVKNIQLNVPVEYATEDEVQDAIVEMGIESRIVTDQAGVIKLCSPTAANICGYDPRELLGKHASILIPDDMKTKHLVAFNLKANEKNVGRVSEAVSCRVLMKDGRTRPVSIITRISKDHLDRLRIIVTLTPVEDIEKI